jgi:aldehyde dehydrogenase (NAD+)
MSDHTQIHSFPSYLSGKPVMTPEQVKVHYPYTGELVGTVARITPAQAEEIVQNTLAGGPPLSRYQRYEILERARRLLGERAEEFAQLIRHESGLCVKETRYEVGRAQDVLMFAAIETLRDDGQIFSGDVSPQGKERKIFTLREPLRLVLGITPFNHPLNQVAHKVAPAIAAGAPILLKPSEKTPLTAMSFARLLYEAGLPGWMLSMFVGSHEQVIEPLIRDPRVELVTFTGGTPVGYRIASIAGYKKLCLELGGNSPLLILEDADLDLAATLACEGCFRNSGQRCTSARRLLVDEKILTQFTDRFVERARAYRCGDPADPNTTVGTVISEAAAVSLEGRIKKAVADGAKVLLGGKRRGALLEPTIVSEVPRTTEMVREESFGPVAPILAVKDLDDAIALANATNYGLSSGVVTNDMAAAIKAVKGIRAGTVNVNQIPGYRIESSPFGGVKDSGLGIKEGVIEAMKFMSTVKTFSMPW